MTHLEFDFETPIWRHLYRELSYDHTLVRYDARGNGLSDRDVEEVSFEAFVTDLETVVDAVGLDRFALLGISQGCAVHRMRLARSLRESHRGAVHMQVTTIGLDIAKNVFHVHGTELPWHYIRSPLAIGRIALPLFGKEHAAQKGENGMAIRRRVIHSRTST